MMLALLLGALVGAGIIARKGSREGRKTAVPFGPFLAAGGVIAVFAGHELVSLYTDHFL
jgi:prepilin signal peptidase PulO-like enzyme (type II secretory pathway)